MNSIEKSRPRRIAERAAALGTAVVLAGCAGGGPFGKDKGNNDYDYNWKKIKKIEELYPGKCSIPVPAGEPPIIAALQNRPVGANVGDFEEAVRARNGIKSEADFEKGKKNYSITIVIPCERGRTGTSPSPAV